MKKLVSVTCPELDSPEWGLTIGKTYPIIKEELGTFSIKDDNGFETHYIKSDFILNYEPDTTERSREIVYCLINTAFHAEENMWSYDSQELIQAAKDFGLDELANEMEECLR